MKQKILIGIAAVVALGSFTACSEDTDADVVSHNISEDADNFKVLRRIVQQSTFTDTIMLEVVGYCNIVEDGSQLEVTCKQGDDAYFKHFMKTEGNATYMVEQLEASDVSDDFYKVTYKPTTILPDIDIR